MLLHEAPHFPGTLDEGERPDRPHRPQHAQEGQVRHKQRREHRNYHDQVSPGQEPHQELALRPGNVEPGHKVEQDYRADHIVDYVVMWPPLRERRQKEIDDRREIKDQHGPAEDERPAPMPLVEPEQPPVQPFAIAQDNSSKIPIAKREPIPVIYDSFCMSASRKAKPYAR